MRGEVNVADAALPEASFGERQETERADASDQGGTLPHRCCMILVQAAGVTDGGGANGL